MTDLTRENNAFQKKGVCVMAVPINEGVDKGEILAASDDHLLGKIPLDAVITNAFIQVKTVSDAATSAVATLGTTEGGSELLTAADLTTLGAEGTFVPGVETGTGKDLWLGLTYTGAATAVGEYVIVVEYVEYNLNTGDLTNFTS